MTSNIVKFRDRDQLARDEAALHARGTILVFKTIMPETGWKRKRWVVVVIFLDGSHEWEDGPRDEATAMLVASFRALKYGFPVANLGVLK